MTLMPYHHPNCYGQKIGSCSQKLSREHYVSDKVLRAISQAENKVRVSGLKFLPSGVEKEIGISSLTGKILCKSHNSALSGYDTAGLDFFTAMERVIVPGSPPAPIRISGDRLEAWMLKTLVGGVYSGAFPIPNDIMLNGTSPPSQFLAVLFEHERLPDPLGLYLWYGPDTERFLTDHHVLRMQVVPGALASGGTQKVLCGLMMWVFGIEFYLSVLPLPDPAPGRWQQMIYRPTQLIGPTGESFIIEWNGIGGDRPARFSNVD